MRGVTLVLVAALAFVCVSAQTIIPENANAVLNTRPRYYLQTSVSNTSNAFGTFGVDFAMVANYRDPTLPASDPRIGAIPNANGVNRFEDTVAINATDSLAQNYARIVGSTTQPTQTVGSITIPDGARAGDVIGRTSFTPRSEFASATLGQAVWVLGGYDASFYPGLTNIPLQSLNDVHISLDSGSHWAEVEDGEELDNPNPLHWSVRHGNAAVAYQYAGPFTDNTNTVPAYYVPCPSKAYGFQGATNFASSGPTATWGPLTQSDYNAIGGLPSGCTNYLNAENPNVPNFITNFIQVQSNNKIAYGATYTAASASGAPGVVPYPTGRYRTLTLGAPVANAVGFSAATTGARIVALLMTAGSGGIPFSTAPVSDAWLSLDLGLSWSLQCFTPEPLNNNGPAGSSIIPADNTNLNTAAQYQQNLNFGFTQSTSPAYTGPAGYYPANVASCGFQARVYHTMVAVPGTGSFPTSVLLIGGYVAAQFSVNDVWRTTNNGQTWTQINGCDYANLATIKYGSTIQAVNAFCVSAAGYPQSQQVFSTISNPNTGATYSTGPTIWSGRNQFASTVTRVVSTANGNQSPRIIVVGGLTNLNDASDVWASDDVVTQPGVEAAYTNYLVSLASGGAPTGQADSPPLDFNQQPLYGQYQYNLLGHWTYLKLANPWFPRRGHGVAYLACLGQLFLVGGLSTQARTSAQDTTSLSSLNDVWYSSDDGSTWNRLAANGQAGLFPKRDLFGVLTTSTSLVILGGDIQTVNGPRLAFDLLNTAVYPVAVYGVAPNNGHPFYGDVWASAFASYTYGPYGPCNCNVGTANFGFQQRAYACASGTPFAQGCCITSAITLTRCSCYTWSNPYFVTDNVGTTTANTRIQYSYDSVTGRSPVVDAQCGANKCDVYPTFTYLYARSDCYDTTYFNLVNYTIEANTNTKAAYELATANNGLSPFVNVGAAFSASNPSVINTFNWPVVRDFTPYAAYNYLGRNGNGYNTPISGAQSIFFDARDNPCDGYFAQYVGNGTSSLLPGGNAFSGLTAQRDGLNQAAVDATDFWSANIAAGGVLATGVPSCDSNTQSASTNDKVSKDDCVYNNLGLARAYYVNYVDLEDYERAYLTSASLTYNLYQGFYFTAQRQPQLLFPCNRPLCRFCRYTRPTYNSACPGTCGGLLIPLDEFNVRCIDQFTRDVGDAALDQTLFPASKAIPAVQVNAGVSGRYIGFGDPSAYSCCTDNFNPAFIDPLTGRTTQPFLNTATGAANPYGITNVAYPAPNIPCATTPCPTHIKGDPEFLGFSGQNYEIHGIPDQVFNIITSPLVQYNARFVFLGKASKHQCDKTRTHPWTHAGTYLGELGFKTAGGDEIVMKSGNCKKGIKSITVNGAPLRIGQKVSLKHQVKDSGVHQSIYRKDAFEVVLALAEFDIVLTNSDHFFNQEVSMTAYGEELLQSHGLLGQTWKNETYVVDGIKRVIEGVPTDYLVTEDDLMGESFTYNKFNL